MLPARPVFWHPFRRAPAATAEAEPCTAPLVELPAGMLQLLVLQPSPFCNLDCSYCYLPDRNRTDRMPLDVLDRVLEQLASSGLVGARLSVVWHAGEPMAVPRAWYEHAFELIDARFGIDRITHHFQTNAVLVDAAWCAFFQRHRVRVGVSIDGPADLHDRCRRTRDGRGTHARVMQGVARLREAGIEFHAICVLTRDALACPDALFEFFRDLNPVEVGFNVEEVEAVHGRSSLQAVDADHLVRAFWQRLMQRIDASAAPRLRVREVAMVLNGLRDPLFGQRVGNAQNLPGRILSVAHDGAFCFWSPELLGATHALRGQVVLGNLATEVIDWSRFAQRPALREWQAEIDRGVDACRRECEHFRLCLGGAPANKLAEHGTMAATETMACRLGQKAVIDAVTQALDARLPA